jgi:predicted phage replisome organizer
MAEVKWIKITTDVFDDEKILLIESMPDANAIIVVWFKLLCLAGKQNNNGVFLMNDKIPYTEKMLSTIFRINEATVQMALNVFEQFGMIDIIDGVITIPNWNKHQTLDAYEKKKERDRIYQAERREKQRLQITKSSDSKTTQSSDIAISEEDKEKDKEVEGDKEIIICDSDEPQPPKKVKHKYGEYNNVLLTDDELSKLKTEYSDYEERIERLSSYIASKGTKYKSHYATIRNWARKDKEQPKKSSYQESIENRMSVVDNW